MSSIIERHRTTWEGQPIHRWRFDIATADLNSLTEWDLPEEDGRMQNGHEHPQSILLTQAAEPILDRLHPDGQYFIGRDTGIYFHTPGPNSRLRGISPDWYYIPGVRPGTPEGFTRRSYLLWRELVRPLIAIEYLSTTDSGELDRTPEEGKFWMYENWLQPKYYVVYDPEEGGTIEAFEFDETRYERMETNDHGHFVIAEMEMALGLWRATYFRVELPWLRWFDPDGTLLPSADERAEQERDRAERLAAKLREMGINPDEV